MAHGVAVKICGLRRPADIDAVAQSGGRYGGFVFFAKSPRNIDIETARTLALHAPVGLAKVALTVNADDAFLDQMMARVPIDILQLHGAESPERVRALKHRFGVPVMKALGIADADDLPKIDQYAAVADMLLIDAKPPKDGNLPGGNGLSFDWRLIAGRRWSVPWMLAGGLRADNVAQAVQLTGARMVDLSSGVESAPGVKDATLIADFMAALK